MKTLINVSNHSSASWSDDQKAGWDAIVDVPHPPIDPHTTPEDVRAMANHIFSIVVRKLYKEYRDQKHVRGYECKHPVSSAAITKRLLRNITWHIAGEWAFFYSLVSLVRKHNGVCVCACSERRVVETVDAIGDCTKKVLFSFVQWREIK